MNHDGRPPGDDDGWDLEFEDQPTPAKADEKVAEFTGIPWRYTPELIVRSLFGHLDRLESIVVFVTYKGNPNPVLLKSPGISGGEWLALSAVAYEHGARDLIVKGPLSPVPENPPDEK